MSKGLRSTVYHGPAMFVFHRGPCPMVESKGRYSEEHYMCARKVYAGPDDQDQRVRRRRAAGPSRHERERQAVEERKSIEYCRGNIRYFPEQRTHICQPIDIQPPDKRSHDFQETSCQFWRCSSAEAKREEAHLLKGNSNRSCEEERKYHQRLAWVCCCLQWVLHLLLPNRWSWSYNRNHGILSFIIWVVDSQHGEPWGWERCTTWATVRYAKSASFLITFCDECRSEIEAVQGFRLWRMVSFERMLKSEELRGLHRRSQTPI